MINIYRQRTENRPDTEHKQALIRIIIVSIALSYTIFMIFFGSGQMQSVYLALFSEVITLSIFIHILARPEVNTYRRVLGLIHDQLIMTFFLLFMGEKASLFLFVYSWVSVGNGFRYGVRYLYASAILGTAGMLCLIIFDPFWHQSWFFGFGVLIMNVAVAGYTGFLLKQLTTAQSNLEKMATHDSLTGLANRRLLTERLKISMMLNSRHQKNVGVLYFDLDGFKLVNDKYGHQVGDELLKCVTEKVGQCIRESDTFARLGGDEFVVVLDSLSKPEDDKIVSKRILTAISSIKQIQGHSVEISASIGVARQIKSSTTDELSPEQFVKIADDAMYRAKKSGKGRIEFVEI